MLFELPPVLFVASVPTATRQRYVVEKAAPCFVATWSPLSVAASGQDCLFVRTNSAEELQFKLGVMIAKHQNKFVCMFRYVTYARVCFECWLRLTSDRQATVLYGTDSFRTLFGKGLSAPARYCPPLACCISPISPPFCLASVRTLLGDHCEEILADVL